MISAQFDDRQLAKATPIIVQLEALTQKIGDDIAEATHKAILTAEKVAPQLKRFYKFKHLIGITVPPRT